MRGVQTKVAAGFSLVALGSLAGYAVGAGGDQPAQATAAKRQPVEVRTQTIRRTIRVVKHEKPRLAPHSSPQRRPRRHPPRVTQVAAVPRTVPVAPQPSHSTPVRTRTSGGGSAGRGEREHEHEHAAEREVGDD